MFGLSWAETFVIAVIALIIIGPKDLPPLIKAGKQCLNKLKSMQRDVKSSFNQILEETELSDVKMDLEAEADAINDEINTIVDMYGNKQRTYDLSDIIPDSDKDDKKNEEKDNRHE